MIRRSTGFVSKRPHTKSRGGCTTCKRKKVKCDEALPKCSYCTLRKLDCTYGARERTTASPTPSRSPDLSAASSSDWESIEDEDFNTPLLSTAIVPAVVTSIGPLSKLDLRFLTHYKTSAFRTITVRDEAIVDNINRDILPQMGIAQPHLLFALLSVSATHLSILSPNPQAKNQATLYRQKTLTAYNDALKAITPNNYESLIVTSLLIQILVPPPDLPCTDDDLLTWMSQYLSMTHGIRLLASLRWNDFEKISIAPLFRRELKKLPPPPAIKPPDPRLCPENMAHPNGDNPFFPNPPSFYKTQTHTPSPADSDMSNLPFEPQQLMGVGKTPSWYLPAPAFLPPPLLALLRSLVDPPVPTDPSAPMDLHRATLLPVIHALSPIFLSLYYFRLSPDVYVRIIVLPTFLTPEFLFLVRAREPRALVVMGWFFAFLRLIPDMFWLSSVGARVLQAVSNVVMRSGDKLLMDAVEGAYRIVRLVESRGREVAARSVFEGWEGVEWERGGMEGRVFQQSDSFC
ncbi:hypothetical protein EJ04DRAFT_494088 [Polyplosphaeria fusca]|uniref:Zn(2)-C6 fungal-type domain-containing protein n=1 Tax=Polyplosphaeria fusca TaxID=682080 RepID=A0A9P4QX61_9PLEO|nr:hypothetical protein EJ04DRAFT_494088 [Polyplosphaeria fusca]